MNYWAQKKPLVFFVCMLIFPFLDKYINRLVHRCLISNMRGDSLIYSAHDFIDQKIVGRVGIHLHRKKAPRWLRCTCYIKKGCLWLLIYFLGDLYSLADKTLSVFYGRLLVHQAVCYTRAKKCMHQEKRRKPPSQEPKKRKLGKHLTRSSSLVLNPCNTENAEGLAEQKRDSWYYIV